MEKFWPHAWYLKFLSLSGPTCCWRPCFYRDLVPDLYMHAHILLFSCYATLKDKLLHLHFLCPLSKLCNFCCCLLAIEWIKLWNTKSTQIPQNWFPFWKADLGPNNYKGKDSYLLHVISMKQHLLTWMVFFYDDKHEQENWIQLLQMQE